MVALSPFHADLETPLLTFGGEPWCILDACEGTAIWGAPGSGKSSGSGRAIARAFLAAGMGGIVLCAKTDEAATWLRYTEQAGRSRDVIHVDASATQRFNILDWASKNIATPGFEGNLVDMMTRMIEATKMADSSGKGGDGDNSYFITNAMKWVRNAFPLLLLAYGTLRMRDLKNLIVSAPQSPAQVPEDLSKYRADQADDLPFFIKTMLLAGARVTSLEAMYNRAKAQGAPEAAELKAQHEHAMKLIDEHGDFFFDEYPRLDNRPRTSVESTLTGLIDPFLSGKLADLFCTTTTFSPDQCRDGKIIIFDLPTLRYGAGGATAQTLFKYLFGVAMQRKAATATDRPCFIFADEAQFFLNSADADLLSTARSSKTCLVYLTQDLPTYYAKLGSNARDVAESILSKFGTRIFHTNTSRESNNYAAELIGRVRKTEVNRSTGRTTTTGGGGSTHDAGAGGSHGQGGASTNYGESTTTYMDFELPPDYFATKLRTGSARNNFKVDGVVIRNGRQWKRTKRHWITAEFSQK